MTSLSKFIIHNDLGKPMTLNIEPEGTFFQLDEGQEVSMTDRYTVAPVTLKICCEDGGDPILSIWQGDGEVKSRRMASMSSSGTGQSTVGSDHRPNRSASASSASLYWRG